MTGFSRLRDSAPRGHLQLFHGIRHLGRKQDLKEVDRAAEVVGIPPAKRRDFGRYIEKCKRQGDRGTKNDQGDYTYDELLDKAQEFKGGSR